MSSHTNSPESAASSTAAPAADEKSTGPCAMILLAQPIQLSPTKVAGCFAARHPGIDNEFWGGTEDKGNLWTIAKYTFAIANIYAPIPPGWEPLAGRAQAFWPEAHEVCAHHRAHILVSAIRSEDGRLQTARYTTAAVDAIVDAYPEAVAVIWDLAVVQPRSAYENFGREALGKIFPYPLWIGIHSFRDERMNIVVMTFGLQQFIGREIEIEGPARDIPSMQDKLTGLIEHTLTRDLPIKDGDTIGMSDAERIVVHHRRSAWNGAPVLALSLPGTIPGAFKKYPIISNALAQVHPLLQTLSKVDLFDVEAEDNQVALPADNYVSEERLDSYETGFKEFLLCRPPNYAEWTGFPQHSS